jgi:hypothetical protein
VDEAQPEVPVNASEPEPVAAGCKNDQEAVSIQLLADEPGARGVAFRVKNPPAVILERVSF